MSSWTIEILRLCGTDWDHDMWRESVAKSKSTGEELYQVLIDYSADWPKEEFNCELFVNRHHLSVKRETVFRREFGSLEEAREFCSKEYDVRANDWQIRLAFPYVFQFDYEVTNVGVPQPVPIGFADATIVFRYSEREDFDTGEKRSALNICGSREGLRRLAAMCLLCADSASYDDSFHIHLEDLKGFEGDIEVTIRAPSYLGIIRSGHFNEGTGRIELPPGKTNDTLPNPE